MVLILTWQEQEKKRIKRLNNGKASFIVKWGFTLFGIGAKDHRYKTPRIINLNKITQQHINAIPFLHE